MHMMCSDKCVDMWMRIHTHMRVNVYICKRACADTVGDLGIGLLIFIM